MNWSIVASIAAGGAIGAVLRYAIMSAVGHLTHAGFPWGTLTVNVLGAFVLGAVLEVSALAWSPSPEVRALVVVGILGALTTFSTFTMDLYYLMDRGQMLSAGIYAVGSVLLCLAAFWAAIQAFRAVMG